MSRRSLRPTKRGSLILSWRLKTQCSYGRRMTDSDADNEERSAMQQAAQGVWIIKTKRLGWPGIKQRNSDRD